MPTGSVLLSVMFIFPSLVCSVRLWSFPSHILVILFLQIFVSWPYQQLSFSPQRYLIVDLETVSYSTAQVFIETSNTKSITGYLIEYVYMQIHLSQSKSECSHYYQECSQVSKLSTEIIFIYIRISRVQSLVLDDPPSTKFHHWRNFTCLE